MLSQEQLNSMSLKEASELISSSIIAERNKLSAKKRELEDLQEHYKEVYKHANDGDASENSALEIAIVDMKTNTGDMVAVIKKIQLLDGIEDASFIMATCDFTSIVNAVNQLDDRGRSKLMEAFEISDISEFQQRLVNMSYKQYCSAVVNFDKYWADLISESIMDIYGREQFSKMTHAEIDRCVNEVTLNGLRATERLVITELDNFKTLKVIPKYNHCGIVVLYSTVRVRLLGKTFTYKIYPKGLSFIDEGVIAQNSRLATALMGRKVGDIVSIHHSSNGSMLDYEIVEIY